MSEARADALLKSALEKIVYFEAKVEQLQSDGAAAIAEAERLRGELSSAAQREIALRRKHAEFEVTLERAHREREDLLRVNEALRNERKGWLDKLLEAAQIGSADASPDALDLASFIAALRSEAWGPKRGSVAGDVEVPRPVALEVAHPPSPPPEPPSELAVQAERLSREGRLATTSGQLQRMSAPHGLAEQTLFGFSVHELSSPDSRARVRAAERLRSLGDHAAAPALAAALHAETEPSTQVCLLSALSQLAGREGAEVVLPFCDAPVPEVRIAALKALLTLDPSRAQAHLEAASDDPDPRVRRRAALLALGRPEPQTSALPARAMKDADPHVRRLSTLALAATGGPAAKATLLDALDDPEPTVRKAAASSLSLLLGRDVLPLLALEPLQRRREIRRLATARPEDPARAPVQLQARRASAGPSTPAEPALRPSKGTSAPGERGPTHAALPRAQGTRVAVVTEVAVRPEPLDEALGTWVLVELRAAIRGRTLEELMSAGDAEAASLEKTCAQLAARGQVVRRGRKYFVA